MDVPARVHDAGADVDADESSGVGDRSGVGLPENNFRASGNYSRFMDPEYDALYARYTQTIPLPERRQIVEQAIRFFAEQQLKMGIFYDAASTMINNRLLNVHARRVAWGSHLWDVK